MSASNDLGQWYKSVPKITRACFTASIIVCVAARLGLVRPHNLILMVNPIIKHFQIWRLLTAVLFYPMGFNYLINLYFLYQYSTRLETSTFNGKPADYVFCLTFLWLCNIIVGSILTMPILMDGMILSVMYIWCQLNKETIMSFWFGMQFKAMYMPWVIMLFNWIMSGSFLTQLCGIVIGHLYFFLVFKYPQDFGGPRLLQTPSFLYRYFPNEQTGISGFGTAPIPRRQPGEADDAAANRGRQAFGGRGHVLGDH
jgi:derlin-1